MTHNEFIQWLAGEVQSERMTQNEMDELISQKELFEENRSMIETHFSRRVVGYVDGNLMNDERIHGLIDRANEKSPGKMIYFEPIGFTLL